jgi:pimeloyl-ACP methyl ester carboxylesterase
MDRFERDGLVFDVDDRGPADGEGVVLLHGFPENRTCWDGVVSALHEAGYRTLAPDQRGYSPGARPKRASAYVTRELTADVLALSESAGLARFHVVGHDWGGAVAWAFAGEHPERVRTLTVLSTPHPRAFRRALVTGTDQAARSKYMAFFQLRGTAERTLRRDDGARFVGTLVASGLPEDRARGYVEFLLRDDDAMTGALNWYRAIRIASSARVPTIIVPTLYAWGTRDDALGRDAAELTARYVGGPYRFEVLEGASHWLPEELPDRVAGLVLEHAATDTGEA